MDNRSSRVRVWICLCTQMRSMLLWAVMLCWSVSATAQRNMDQLDRGLVAVKTTAGVYLSWRILGEEYYDVSYNVYRNGTKLNNTPLTVWALR